MTGWRDSALCAQVDPDLFFPSEVGGSNQIHAQALCRRCAVRVECAAAAIAAGETYGTWGGMTPRQIAAAGRDVKEAAA